TRVRSEEFVTVPAPRSRDEQILQAKKLVEARHPGAELRVFHGNAGSFRVDAKHVIAAYQGNIEFGRPREPAEDHDQAVEQLRLIA
ncbi:MAG TPA: hypothetical protein VFD37_01945, partial [Solirubrobacterales bacterium]|nr:hypothetical protein [Solirubrobacterales bacterium]